MKHIFEIDPEQISDNDRADIEKFDSVIGEIKDIVRCSKKVFNPPNVLIVLYDDISTMNLISVGVLNGEADDEIIEEALRERVAKEQACVCVTISHISFRKIDTDSPPRRDMTDEEMHKYIQDNLGDSPMTDGLMIAAELMDKTLIRNYELDPYTFEIETLMDTTMVPAHEETGARFNNLVVKVAPPGVPIH